MEQTCFRYSVQPQTEHIKDYTHTIAVMFEDMVDMQTAMALTGTR